MVGATMIAPVNCNPHCDCAQRLIRCQRAAFDEQQAALRPETPSMVIPASLANDPVERLEQLASRLTRNELLAALEREFPATMGIAPGIPDDSPVELHEFTPEENAAFDRANKHLLLVRAFRDCELDCGCWSPQA